MIFCFKTIRSKKKFWGFDVTLRLDPLPLVILYQVIGFGVPLPLWRVTYYLHATQKLDFSSKLQTASKKKRHENCKKPQITHDSYHDKKASLVFLLLGELKIIMKSIRIYWLVGCLVCPREPSALLSTIENRDLLSAQVLYRGTPRIHETGTCLHDGSISQESWKLSKSVDLGRGELIIQQNITRSDIILT